MKRWFVLTSTLLGVMLALNWNLPAAYTQQLRPLPTTAPDSLVRSGDYIRADRLGITFISSTEKDVSEERYRNALLLGPGWNRWPLYWNKVEAAPSRWDWEAYDQLVQDDVRHQLSINAILLGMPDYRRDGERPLGLNEPIFADGSDYPQPDKAINPDNPWAVFAYEAVSRYKPGGELYREGLLEADQGVRVWEVWNEPDHRPFWGGSVRDYSRLLKVAYLAIKQADPDALVMFGGLLYGTDDNWLAQTLAILINDPAAEDNNYYMDAVAIHNYGDPWRSGWLTLFVRETLEAYGLERPIWLNESGVPIWDDYPGPTWLGDEPEERALRATSQQQAWFFIQSTVYAWSEGADKVFFHQLYDDCGDQPAGTDFPPHQGELCSDDETALCWGDSFGLYRNEPSSVCYSQHPLPGTARPAAQAFRLMAEVFGRQSFEFEEINENDLFVAVNFRRPQQNERIRVLWNRTVEPVTVELTAAVGQAELISLDATVPLRADEQRVYEIDLPPALPSTGWRPAIGGEPLILVEALPERDAATPDAPAVATSDTLPLAATVAATADTSTVSAQDPTAGPVMTFATATPMAVATGDPASDREPPTVTMLDLPEVSPATFTLSWMGEDNSGVSQYFVWVRVNGSEWQPWLETTRTQADYTGVSGETYEFAVWAVDLAGNWSLNANVTPMAVTRVQ